MQDKKTIFIIITRAFITRNLLRSGSMKYFKDRNYKLIIFLLCKEVPSYIIEEFAGYDVEIFPLPKIIFNRWDRLFSKIRIPILLLYTDSTVCYLKYGRTQNTNRARYKTYIYIAFVWFIAHIPRLKQVCRYVDENIFHEKSEEVQRYFNKYKPDLVFSTSIISSQDILFLKEAKRRGVLTVSYPKGWDIYARTYYRFLPDYFMVQNEILRDKLIELQGVKKEKIFVVGFTQFDWYKIDDILVDRGEHLRKYGLDPDLPLIFFGSEGTWADNDVDIAKKIYEWVRNDELAVQCQMIVRPHFSNVKDGHFLWFKNRERVALDESYHISDAFIDNWDPTIDETIEFTNTLKHSNLMITIASTLNLDAVANDIPVVNIGYGAKYRNGRDITKLLYQSDHMGWVLETGGVRVAYSEGELKDMINDYLVNPQKDSAERQILRDRFIYKVDGRSSERMVGVIDDILKK